MLIPPQSTAGDFFNIKLMFNAYSITKLNIVNMFNATVKLITVTFQRLKYKCMTVNTATDQQLPAKLPVSDFFA